MIPLLHGVTDPTGSSASATRLLVLGPSLGTTAETWDAVAERLRPTCRVIRFDLPGHGRSPASTHPFTVAELADAVVALVDSVGGGRFAYAGVSLGGAIGIELAAGPHAGRLDALAIVCSNARIGTPDGWRARAAQVRGQGTASVVAGSAERWFAPGFLQREPDVGGRALSALVDVDDESYAACCEALAGFDRTEHLAKVVVPALVVHGDSDLVVNVADAEELAASIPGAGRVQLHDVGHQAELEAPELLAAALTDLLDGVVAPDHRYAAGLAVRREVLGTSYVDASLVSITPETVDFQRFITEYAWGSVWTRPGLDRRMRSAVTISSLVTGRHWHELELHLQAGLRNGLTRTELTEILLQTAIYAGVPAANSAFGVAKRVFAEDDEAIGRRSDVAEH
ncbi:alpha/beta fold hydrolase [uncultured Amnibacterium sp.]|uniref:bifunctional 3-oxoadipate enol-lactonase/4-carboxymuconolactone decarboxylase PcaDC n=1 Tax=uncultured Amnibacterium sp. TaxID=1631851 RepID=UPI0035CB298F